MGRFETLNDDTKDLVNCLLPGLASSFKVREVADIIPEDIRMRAWDCERRDHIKDETENDPRNWGVQFLKDLMSISRITNGNLAQFQAELRIKVAKHEPKHPWCRLADIKEIKYELEHPEAKNAVVEENVSSEDSYDSYFEELVEPEEPRSNKGKLKRRGHEVYEARVQESSKRRKMASHGRLRRSEEGSFERKPKESKKHQPQDRTTPNNSPWVARRTSRVIDSDNEDRVAPISSNPHPPHMVPVLTSVTTPSDVRVPRNDPIPRSEEPLAVQKLQAELEVAEAELRASRLKFQYIEALERAQKEAQHGGKGPGTPTK